MFCFGDLDLVTCDKFIVLRNTQIYPKLNLKFYQTSIRMLNPIIPHIYVHKFVKIGFHERFSLSLPIFLRLRGTAAGILRIRTEKRNLRN